MVPSHSDMHIAVGRVINACGLHGEFKVYPLSDFKERYQRLERVIIEFENGKARSFTVDKVRTSGEFVFFKLEGIDDRNEAEALRGSYVSINRDEVFPLDKESFYVFDLEGMDVFDPEGLMIGSIIRVEKYPANDVLIVETEHETVMVPAIKKYLVDIDLNSGRIILDLPEGLPSYPKGSI